MIDLAKVRPVVYIKYFSRNILSYELYSTTAYLSFFKKKEKKTKCRRKVKLIFSKYFDNFLRVMNHFFVENSLEGDEKGNFVRNGGGGGGGWEEMGYSVWSRP